MGRHCALAGCREGARAWPAGGQALRSCGLGLTGPCAPGSFVSGQARGRPAGAPNLGHGSMSDPRRYPTGPCRCCGMAWGSTTSPTWTHSRTTMRAHGWRLSWCTSTVRGAAAAGGWQDQRTFAAWLLPIKREQSLGCMPCQPQHWQHSCRCRLAAGPLSGPPPPRRPTGAPPPPPHLPRGRHGLQLSARLSLCLASLLQTCRRAARPHSPTAATGCTQSRSRRTAPSSRTVPRSTWASGPERWGCGRGWASAGHHPAGGGADGSSGGGGGACFVTRTDVGAPARQARRVCYRCLPAPGQPPVPPLLPCSLSG